MMQGAVDSTTSGINATMEGAASLVPGTQERREFDAIPLFRDLYPCTACFCSTSSCYVSEF